jgi:hypothetical protein
LARDTREMVEAWATAHGYDPEQIEKLRRAIALLVYTQNYIEALAMDLSQRINLDGVAVERIRNPERMVASMTLMHRALRKAAHQAPKAESKPPKPPSPPSAPTPRSAPSGRRVISLPK